MENIVEAIKIKLEALKREREQLVANLNANIGAIQVCEQLLKDQDQQVPKKEA